MPKVIKIAHIDVQLSDVQEDHHSFFERNITVIRRLGLPVDSIIIASSSELTFLSSQHCKQLLTKLLKAFPEAKAEIICQGCLGIYASTLHFQSDEAVESALVVMIDAPYDVHQVGLNVAGLGTLDGQDGMLANPGVGLLYLEKRSIKNLAEDDWVVSHVQIMAKTDGLNANPLFVKRITDQLTAMLGAQKSEMVSFDIGAKIAKLCKMYVQPALAKAGFDSAWLPSFEQDNYHSFSLKQLHEILAYKQNMKATPIVIPALGVGGRFGLMCLSLPRHVKQIYYPNPRIIDMPLVETYVNSVKELEQKRHEDAYYARCREVMVTIHKCFLIDNLYFRWTLRLDQLTEIAPFKKPVIASILTHEANAELVN